MTIDDTTIDIHLSKLVGSFFESLSLSLSQPHSLRLDWLVDRRHSTKDWNERAVAIRAKIQQAILDMPEHPQIKTLLESACETLAFDLDDRRFRSTLDLDYFSSVKIVEILKETEKESKNMFGMYSSQRMKVNPVPSFLPHVRFSPLGLEKHCFELSEEFRLPRLVLLGETETDLGLFS